MGVGRWNVIWALCRRMRATGQPWAWLRRRAILWQATSGAPCCLPEIPAEIDPSLLGCRQGQWSDLAAGAGLRCSFAGRCLIVA